MGSSNLLAFVPTALDPDCPGVIDFQNKVATNTPHNQSADDVWNNAMLSRLLRNRGGGGQGRLRCHPAQQEAVADWLGQHPHLGWELELDTALEEGALMLSTERGSLPLRW